MWRVCFGFRGTQKSPKETLFALSGSENSPVLLGRSKSPFPGVGRGCAASRGTQLTEEALKLQPFVFILLKYLHCDANADFQSEKEEEEKKYLFLPVQTVVGSELNSKCSHWRAGFFSLLVFCQTLETAGIKWAAFLFIRALTLPASLLWAQTSEF